MRVLRLATGDGSYSRCSFCPKTCDKETQLGWENGRRLPADLTYRKEKDKSFASQ